MRRLTKIQIQFLIEEFFKNETNVENWRHIARKLLENGECVVAGDKCIWVGAIGTFITTEIVEGYFGCLKYVFNLESFLSSNYYKEKSMVNFKLLCDEKKKIDDTLKGITELSVTNPN